MTDDNATETSTVCPEKPYRLTVWTQTVMGYDPETERFRLVNSDERIEYFATPEERDTAFAQAMQDGLNVWSEVWAPELIGTPMDGWGVDLFHLINDTKVRQHGLAAEGPRETLRHRGRA